MSKTSDPIPKSPSERFDEVARILANAFIRLKIADNHASKTDLLPATCQSEGCVAPAGNGEQKPATGAGSLPAHNFKRRKE